MNSVNLHHPLTGPAPLSADSPRLKSAAHEFEASLMQELLKPLQRDALFAPEDSATGGDSDFDSGGSQGSSSALMSFGSEAMARAISERGGFGIATRILDHFRAAAHSSSASSSPKS